jgi:hypothetical protein
MPRVTAVVFALACSFAISAQSPLPATDVTAATIQSFVKALPRDAVSDRPIRVVDVGDTGSVSTESFGRSLLCRKRFCTKLKLQRSTR